MYYTCWFYLYKDEIFLVFLEAIGPLHVSMVKSLTGNLETTARAILGPLDF